MSRGSQRIDARAQERFALGQLDRLGLEALDGFVDVVRARCGNLAVGHHVHADVELRAHHAGDCRWQLFRGHGRHRRRPSRSSRSPA